MLLVFTALMMFVSLLVAAFISSLAYGVNGVLDVAVPSVLTLVAAGFSAAVFNAVSDQPAGESAPSNKRIGGRRTLHSSRRVSAAHAHQVRRKAAEQTWPVCGRMGADLSELNPTPREAAVDGLGILGATMLGNYAITSEELDVAGREVLPDEGLSSVLLVAAVVMLVAYVGLAIRVHGVKEGLRQVFTHAWPTLLAGGILGVITGFPLKAMLSGRSLWVVLGILYAAALAVNVWLYRRGSRRFGWQ